MKTTQAQKKLRGRSRLKTEQSRLKKEIIQKAKKSHSFLDLFLGVLFLFLLLLLMFYFSANDLANIIFPNSYLPFVLLVFLSSFFFLKFIFINQRLVFCLVFNLSIILFFHLQNLNFNYYLILVLIMPPFVWLTINQIEKRLL
ncbi:MAG: hypothetical protein GX943_03470 [Candidatus Pacebacteria bacterium]|jgi:hypothetical protein|nr:hypothetical protein [Candidatus Paceibacterota bacterium]